MNTRTYPRTLNEAFPNTAEYGAAIERPAPMFARSPLASAAVAIVLIFAVVTVFAVSLP